jgi:hypothetical protein
MNLELFPHLGSAEHRGERDGRHTHAVVGIIVRAVFDTISRSI